MDEPIKVSFSQLSNWNRCQRQWEFKYELGWSPIKTKASLQTGSLLHFALKEYYEWLKEHGSNDWQGAKDAAVGWIFSQTAGMFEMEVLARAAQIMQRYPEFAHERDTKYEILAIEWKFELPLLTPAERRYILVGIVDLVVRDKDTGRYWVIDHKSTYHFWKPLEITTDVQLPIYAIAVNQEWGTLPSNILVNQIRTYPYKKYALEPLDKLFLRDPDSRTRQQYYNTLENIGNTVDMLIEHREAKKPFLLNMNRTCSRECVFYGPCQDEFKGYDKAGYLGYTFVQKDTKILLPMFDPELESVGDDH